VGFEPSAVHAGKPTRLCFLFVSWAETIISVFAIWRKIKQDRVEQIWLALMRKQSFLYAAWSHSKGGRSLYRLL